MFATSGYFRGVTCPYFVSGLCERPYCHFRHVKPTVVRDREISKSLSIIDGAVAEDGASSESPNAGKAGPSSLLNMVGQAIKQVERDIERDRASLSSIKSKTSPDAAIGADEYVYRPTPIVSGNTSSGSTSESVKSVKSVSKKSHLEYDPGSSNSAKYKPTPISLLEQKRSHKKGSERSKYVLDSSDHVNDNEYDPAVNFSTAGKKQKRYAPTSAGGERNKKQKLEPEGTPVGDEAVFSDDDENSCSQENITPGKDTVSESTKPKSSDSANSNSGGVYEMDVGAILGIGAKSKVDGKNNKKSKQTSKLRDVITDQSTDKTKKDKSLKSKHVNTNEIGTSKNGNKVSKSTKLNAHASNHDSVCPDMADDAQKERNIFSIMNVDSPDDAPGLKNKSKSPTSEMIGDANTHQEKQKAHSSSSKKGHGHRSSSSRHEKSKHTSHTSSNGSSSSRHKKSSHSHHKHSSSSSKHSSRSSHHDSRSRSSERDRKSSKEHGSKRESSRSHTSSTSRTHRNSTDSSSTCSELKKAPISNVDLFGEDSDESDDVMIVEPPKVAIPVVELSSEESDENESLSHPGKHSIKEKKRYVKDPLPISSESDEESGDDPFTSTLQDLSEGELQSLEKSLDTEDTYDECLRIFNESSKTPRTMVQPKAKIAEKELEEEPTIIVGKKRVARVSEQDIVHSRKPKPKPNARPSPAQVMHQRFLAMQKAAEEAGKRNDESSTSGKVYIAHTVKQRSTPEKVYTPVKVVAKSITSEPAKRVSHIAKPNIGLKRPSIPTDFGSKVPTNVRQRYLNLIIDECAKIYPKEEDAFKRALTEEKAVNGRSTSKNIYLNLAVNCVKRLRSEVSGKNSNQEKKSSTKSGTKFSHEALLGGKMAAKTSFTVKRSGSTSNQPLILNEVDTYHRLAQYALSESQLDDNGFPRMSLEQSGVAVIRFDNARTKVVNTGESNERLCVRCGIRFLVNSDGEYLNEQKCVHHWGKLWKKKIGNSIESRFSCCSEDANGTGCSIGKLHVHEQNKYSNLKGYMKTMPKSPPPDGNYGVFALDCEMVYTKAGLELARVTVVNSKLESVYEQLVKPAAELIDPNTRFSGLVEEDFENVTSTIRDVQAVLLSMFSASTILVGHSLESDLVALKLVHGTVVDTSVIFPHRLGPPFKRALRTLTAEYLRKIIQDDVGGHDSQEDANAAMELMIWKLKEDIKKESRRQ